MMDNVPSQNIYNITVEARRNRRAEYLSSIIVITYGRNSRNVGDNEEDSAARRNIDEELLIVEFQLAMGESSSYDNNLLLIDTGSTF